MFVGRAGHGWLAGLVSAGLVVTGVLVGGPAIAAPPAAPVAPSLEAQLAGMSSETSGRLLVMVHGATLAEAERAVEVTGMTQVTTFRKIDVVVARGSADQIQTARTQPG